MTPTQKRNSTLQQAEEIVVNEVQSQDMSDEEIDENVQTVNVNGPTEYSLSTIDTKPLNKLKEHNYIVDDFQTLRIEELIEDTDLTDFIAETSERMLNADEMIVDLSHMNNQILTNVNGPYGINIYTVIRAIVRIFENKKPLLPLFPVINSDRILNQLITKLNSI